MFRHVAFQSRLHQLQVSHNVFFTRRHLADVTQALLSALQVSTFDVHDAQVVTRLDVVRVVLENGDVVAFSRVDVLQLIHVDVGEKDERFAVRRVELKNAKSQLSAEVNTTDTNLKQQP